jgi:D-amino-acid dehydrogenase
MKADVVIVGGGLAGASSLLALTRAGLSALLLEAEGDLALGASHANGGMLTPSMSDPWNGPGVGRHLLSSLFDPTSPMRLHFRQIPNLATWGLSFLRNSTSIRHQQITKANFLLAAYSRALTEQWTDSFDLNIEWQARGSLKIFETEEAMEGPLRLARFLEQSGLVYHALDADGAIAVEPALRPIGARIAGALHYPDDATGDARAFTHQVAAAARQFGGMIRINERIASIIALRDGFQVLTNSGEAIDAKNIVLAAGMATPALARQLGVSLPIKPAKGYSLTITAPDGLDLPCVSVVDDAMHAAVVRFGRDIRVVGTAEFAGEDRSLDPRRVNNLARLLARLYPDLAPYLDPATGRPWTGLRPMSADGRPFIGQSRRPGVWINAGHGHLGWTMAAGSAQLLADLMTGHIPTIDPNPYALVSRTV